VHHIPRFCVIFFCQIHLLGYAMAMAMFSSMSSVSSRSICYGRHIPSDESS